MLFDAIDLSRPQGGRNRAMLENLYSSGLIVSELINLKLNQIYFDIGFKASAEGTDIHSTKFCHLYLIDLFIVVGFNKGMGR